MNKQNKHPNVREKFISGVAIGALALSGAAPKVAHAQSPSSRSTSPAEVVHISTSAEKRLNTKAQEDVVTLAQHVMSADAKHPGNKTVNNFTGADGKKRAEVEVIVPASTEFGSDNAAYKFSLVAPLAKDGSPDLNKVEALTLSAGSLGDGSSEISANVIIGFNKNPATHFWDFGAQFYNTFTNSTDTKVAGIDPASPFVSEMTSNQLDQIYNDALKIVTGAEQDVPKRIGEFKFAESRVTVSMPPTPTAPNSDGGTPAPDPSGGVTAP